MPLGDHLRELRRRILWALAGIALGAVAAWYLYEPLLAQMTQPLRALEAQGRVAELNFSTVGAGFDLRVQVSVVVGLFLSAPWWIGQLWMYLAPGLHRREKAWTAVFALAGAVLFLAGGALGWWLLPHVVEILTSLTPAASVSLLEARLYLVFFLRVVLTFGIAFLVPLLLVGLNLAGLVRGATYLRGWRWAVVGAFVFAAFANPLPDAWSMIGMALPVLLLYFGAVGLCLLADRRRDRAARTGHDAPVAAPQDGAWT